MTNVSPAALHQVGGQTSSNVLLMLAAEIFREINEALIEEAEQRAEGLLVPRVRRGGNQRYGPGTWVTFWPGDMGDTLLMMDGSGRP
jgi:hypothetical protein